MADTPSRTATYVGLALVVAAIVAGAVQGFSGSVLGAVLALAAVIPAAIGMWKGVQEKTQTGLGMAIGVFILALGTAGVLGVLKIVDWLS